MINWWVAWLCGAWPRGLVQTVSDYGLIKDIAVKRFIEPKFKGGPIEIRAGADEVAIYATPDGLRRLIKCCEELLSRSSSKRTHHMHLEDYELISEGSSPSKVTLAVFNDMDGND